MDKKEINNQINNNYTNDTHFFSNNDKSSKPISSSDNLQNNKEYSNNNYNDINNIDDKNALIKELNENLNIELTDGETLTNETNQKDLKKKVLSIIQETPNDDMSGIAFDTSNQKKESKNNEINEESIIKKEFYDSNIAMSFYGVDKDIENIVKDLQFNEEVKQGISNTEEGYLEAIEFDKYNMEEIQKITKSVNANDLYEVKKIMELMEFDGKMISKISYIKYLLYKSRDIDNKDINEMKKKMEEENDLFAWRDIFPGPESFFRGVMYSFLEDIILSRNINAYKYFLFHLNKNIEDQYFKRILNYYKIDTMKTKIILILIYYALSIQDVEASIETAHSLFVKIYNFDINFDLLLILNLKFIIYKYLKINEKKLYTREYPVPMGSLLPNRYNNKTSYNFKDFYDNNLLQLNREAERITISVIPFILRRNLFIYSLDQKNIKHISVNTDNKENMNNNPIRLFILNGSYEIVYSKEYYNRFQKVFSKYSSISNKMKTVFINNNDINLFKEKILGNIDGDENESFNNLAKNRELYINPETIKKPIKTEYNVINNQFNKMTKSVSLYNNNFNFKNINNNANYSTIDNANKMNSNENNNIINGNPKNNNNVNKNNNDIKVNNFFDNKNINMNNNNNNNCNQYNATNNNIINNDIYKNRQEKFIKTRSKTMSNLIDFFENKNKNTNENNLNQIKRAININTKDISNIKNNNIINKKECPTCKQQGSNDFYCQKCILIHLIAFMRNSYISFIKKNISNLIKQKPIENLEIFLSNLTIIFPNKTKMSFAEAFFLLSEEARNNFNEKMNSLKSSLCLGCFNYINDQNNIMGTEINKNMNNNDGIIFKFPCGCAFCSGKCLNRFINAVPISKMKSFICACGVEYEYMQLKFLLYFSLSHNLIKFKNEILRYMYEIINKKCCKCNKVIPIIEGNKSDAHIIEVMDKEADKIFGIHRFNHFICDICNKSRDITKNNFYCNLCSSEHSIMGEKNYKNCQIICSIF